MVFITRITMVYGDCNAGWAMNQLMTRGPHLEGSKNCFTQWIWPIYTWIYYSHGYPYYIIICIIICNINMIIPWLYKYGIWWNHMDSHRRFNIVMKHWPRWMPSRYGLHILQWPDLETPGRNMTSMAWL